MLTPDRWALVAGIAFAVVALVGLGQIVLGGEGGFAWVIVAVAAVSSVAGFAMALLQRRH